MNNPALDRIRRFANAHRVALHVGPVPADHSAPFDLSIGLDWQKRRLYITKESAQYASALGGLLHELGHLLASADEPDDQDELNFLAWEHLLAKRLDLVGAWQEQMVNYSTGGFLYGDSDGWDFGFLPLAGQRAFLRYAENIGKKAGTISPNGRMLYPRDG